jgi:hypothetical protein
MKVLQVLLLALAAYVVVGQEVTKARLEVGEFTSHVCLMICSCVDMWWMTFEFASQGEAIHQ